jgi:mono/diheme cytochrome c family protein
MKIQILCLIPLILAPLCRAEDAATLFKTKCASCHGATGAGKSAMKGSNLLTDEVKKQTDEQLTEAIASGGPKSKSSHAYEKKGVTRDQVGLLVKYVRELQQK